MPDSGSSKISKRNADIPGVDMKLFFIGVLCLLVFGVFAGDPVVVFPRQASAVEKTAVKELTEHLSLIMGKKINAVSEETEVAGRKIYVGATRMAAGHTGNAVFGPEESLLKSVGRDLIITGGNPRGTLYGVYEFLERFGGVVWFFLDDTFIPQNKKFFWPDNINIRICPVFRYRGIYVFGINQSHREELRKYLSRTRDNLFWQGVLTADERARYGITPVLGRPAPLNTLHHYSVMWPVKGMESARSLNVAGERDVSRSYSGPGQVCFSSLLGRRTVAWQMVEFIKEDRREFAENPPRFYNLSINDTSDRCECKECLKRAEKYKSYAGTVLEYVNAVAEEVEKYYPDIIIQTSAYLFTEKAPEGIKMRSNVVNRLSPSPYVNCQTMLPLTSPVNRSTLQNLQKWSKLGKIQIWNYWVVFGHYAGRNAGVTNISALVTNLKLFHRLGSDYVFSECEFPESASFHALRLYLGSHLLRNPYQDIEPLLNRFFHAYFGSAADAMRRFFDYQNKRQTAELKQDCMDSSQRTYLDADYFRSAEKFLSEAEKNAVGNAAVLRRIRRERISVDIARLSAAGMPPDRSVAIRLKKNWIAALNRLYGKNWPQGEKARIDSVLLKVDRPSPGGKYPLAASLAKRVRYDIAGKDFNALDELSSFGLRLVDDPESVSGKAMRMADPLRSPAKGYHKKILQTAVYSRSSKKNILNRSLMLKNDGKYHLYRLGICQVEPLSLLLLHPTWQIRHHLDHYLDGINNNKFDIYVSIKATGPAYVPGSKNKNALWIDRILLLTPEQNSAVEK